MNKDLLGSLDRDKIQYSHTHECKIVHCVSLDIDRKQKIHYARKKIKRYLYCNIKNEN